MLDVEDFDAVFQGVVYTHGIQETILDHQHALGGTTFFERLMDLLKIKVSNSGRKFYPPKNPQKLRELHHAIVTSNTTLHNKHCLIFYLLKDLSRVQHDDTELSDAFARSVHLEKRFWTFIEGLWALDHLDFSIAVGHLTHPSIIPTFPDEIMLTLLKGKSMLLRLGNPPPTAQDDLMALAYYNCVKPPLETAKVRNEFAKYLAGRNITEAYYWIHTRPEHEQNSLLEILVEQALARDSYSSDDGDYKRVDRALEFVGLSFTEREEEFIEKFLTEGQGRNYEGAKDTALMRKIATGKLVDVANDNGVRGRNYDGVNWGLLRDGVRKGLGPRVDEESFTA